MPTIYVGGAIKEETRSIFLSLCLTSPLILFGCQNHKPEFFGAKVPPRSFDVVGSRQMKAGIFEKIHLEIPSQKQMIRQTLTLESDPPLVTSFKQIDRPKGEESFRQGHDGDGPIFERFFVQEADKLDLLVVVDNSSSMSPYQDRLATGLKPLLSHISNTDWRIMVTLTSSVRRANPQNPRQPLKIYGCPRINQQDPEDRAYLSRDDFQTNETLAMERFRWKVSAGEQGEPIERGVLASVSGLIGECGDPTRPWTREGSHKAVLLLSDEENCGSDPDQNCDQDADADPRFFVDRAPENTKFFALLHDKDQYTDCADDGYVRKPDDYRYLIQTTGGIEGNICSGRYDETLVEISRHIQPVPVSKFSLAYRPNLKTVEILVDGQPISQTPIIEQNTLRFDPPLSPSAKILQVQYKHDPVEVRHSFKLLSKDIDPNSVNVKIDDRPVPPEHYEYIARSSTVIFNPTPPDRSFVRIGYRKTPSLPTRFPLEGGALPDSIDVKIDGKNTTNFQFDSSRNVLEFLDPPHDGADVQITYEDGSQRQTAYPAVLPKSTEPETISAIDSTTGESIPVVWQSDLVTVPYSAVQKGRQLTLDFSFFPQSSEYRLPLPDRVNHESITIRGPDDACVNSAYVANSEIVIPCSPRLLDNLSVDYELYFGIRDTFPMEGGAADRDDLRVFVDQERIYDFEILEDKIRIPARYLSKDSLVRIDHVRDVDP
jgi:hypothetical protein